MVIIICSGAWRINTAAAAVAVPAWDFGLVLQLWVASVVGSLILQSTPPACYLPHARHATLYVVISKLPHVESSRE